MALITSDCAQMLCDNCEVRRFTLTGGGCEPDIGVTKFVNMDVRPGRNPPPTLQFEGTEPSGEHIDTLPLPWTHCLFPCVFAAFRR